MVKANTPYTAGFLLFWAQCRKDHRGGKIAAQRAWNDKRLEPRAQQVADTMAYMVKNEYSKKDKLYVPHASTWINAGFQDTGIPEHVDIASEHARMQALREELRRNEDAILSQERALVDVFIEQYTDDELEEMLAKALESCRISRLRRKSTVSIRESIFQKALIYDEFFKDTSR